MWIFTPYVHRWWQKFSTKKVKVYIYVCQTFTFCCNLADKIKIWQALTGTYRDIAIFSELYNFSLLGGTSSILRDMSKNHPVVCFPCSFSWDKEGKMPEVGIMESLAMSVDTLDGHHLLEVPITKTLSDDKIYRSQP